MARSPFSLYIKKLASGRRVWYARFWSEGAQRYTVSKSTEIEVVGVSGGKRKAESVVRDVLLPKIANQTDVSKMPLCVFLLDCWKPGSKMIREKEAEGVGVHIAAAYISANHSAIVKWVQSSPLSSVRVGDLTKALVNDWKLSAAAAGCGSRRLNATLQAIRVPITWAVGRGDLVADPLAGVKKVGYVAKEKGVLTVPEVQGVLEITGFDDPRVLFGIQLSLLVGLRRGELRGLRWKDIDRAAGQITITNNYVDDEKDKGCKWGSARIVFLPSVVLPALDAVAALSPWTDPNVAAGESPRPDPDSYILFDLAHRDRPCSTQVLQRGFVRLVRLVGIDDEARKTRRITLHSCRHTAATLALNAGIPDAVVQGLAGWKSGEMMARYSHVGQVIDFAEARKKLEASLSRKDDAKGMTAK